MAFKQGQSGNINGRPKGSKNRSTELQKLLEPHAPALVEKAVEMALNGDTAAMKMCLDRIIPAMKSMDHNIGFNGNQPVVFKLNMGKKLHPK